jgi:hypothetical protein
MDSLRWNYPDRFDGYDLSPHIASTPVAKNVLQARETVKLMTEGLWPAARASQNYSPSLAPSRGRSAKNHFIVSELAMQANLRGSCTSQEICNSDFRPKIEGF